MKDRLKTGFSDRAATSLAAKQAMLAKFKPKAAIAAPEGVVSREAEKDAERERLRLERAAAKEARRLAAEAAVQARIRAEIDSEEARLNEIRSARKERQAREKEAAKERRELRMQLYGKISANASSGGNAG